MNNHNLADYKFNPELPPPGVSWGHFSEIDEGYGRRPGEVDWESLIPSWLIFLVGMAIGAGTLWILY